ncbi:hypothetical protein [Fimbriiglobus ruber]|uniref:Uncharacterized protein n=1 Tax=Fimbriiglobus ruber TaxID=1908690 RepID=A0A225DQM7_9BACT|nr:hypothetical protein [Fimbriiglobus ruber]OWK41924.1 hypothetical protein FRUB_04002 [Fimbriiglobus ruber]
MPLTEIPSAGAAILGRLVEPNRPALSPETARAILGLGFGQVDRERMDELAAKSRIGSLTAAEQTEIEAYSRVGSLLGMLKSKARLSLRRHSKTNEKPEAE